MSTGLIFGSFDPPHLGHLLLAKSALSVVDEVKFIPAYQNPFKEHNASFETRCNMLERLIDSYPSLCENIGICYIEGIVNDRYQNTYTYKVLEEIHKILDNVYIIVTEETLKEIPKWKNSQWILDNSKFILVNRTSWDNYNANIEYDISSPFNLDIHSVHIRQMIKFGGNPCPFIPETPRILLEFRKSLI